MPASLHWTRPWYCNGVSASASRTEWGGVSGEEQLNESLRVELIKLFFCPHTPCPPLLDCRRSLTAPFASTRVRTSR